MLEYSEYLQKTVAPSTQKRYERELKLYFNYLSKLVDNDSCTTEKPAEAGYEQIMNYLGYLRQKHTEGNTVNCALHAIKKYYDCLMSMGIRADHPAKSIRLRDKKSRDIQLQNLFTAEELTTLLLLRKERYQVLKNRNLLILSLLIYQGLTTGECCNIDRSDIHLPGQTIYIKSSRRSNRRTLELKENQLEYLMDYLSTDRPKLLAMGPIQTEKLLITKKGTVEKGEGISYLLDSQKDLFPGRKLNPRTIRQSLIANKLAGGEDLRKVQVFAGHKYPDTTEKYRQTYVENLKIAIHRYHPMS